MKDRATILCRRRDKILLVTRGWSRWALPGGTIRRTESPHEAATRELAEETTLVVDTLTYLFQFRGLGKRHHIFVVDLAEHLSPRPHNEIAACAWFRPEETPMLVTSVTTREIVRLAFRHPDAVTLQPPFGDDSVTSVTRDEDDGQSANIDRLAT